jgi:hypothetical protein
MEGDQFPAKTLCNRCYYFLEHLRESHTMTMIEIANDDDAARASLLESPPDNASESKSILFFWADWHAPSRPGGAFDDAARALVAANRGDDSGVRFYHVMAEEAPRLSRKVRQVFFDAPR